MLTLPACVLCLPADGAGAGGPVALGEGLIGPPTGRAASNLPEADHQVSISTS